MTNNASTWCVLKHNEAEEKNEDIILLTLLCLSLPECSHSTISDSAYLFSDVHGLRNQDLVLESASTRKIVLMSNNRRCVAPNCLYFG